jgi:hypothetical protein
MSKEGWIGAANPAQPFSRSFGTFAQALELPARPADLSTVPAGISSRRSATLTTIAFDDSSLQWLEINT